MAKTCPTGVTQTVLMREIKAIQTIDQLRAVGDTTFSGWRLKVSSVIPLKTASRRVGVCSSLISGSQFAAGPIPGSPFVDYQLHMVGRGRLRPLSASGR